MFFLQLTTNKLSHVSKFNSIYISFHLMSLIKQIHELPKLLNSSKNLNKVHLFITRHNGITCFLLKLTHVVRNSDFLFSIK